MVKRLTSCCFDGADPSGADQDDLAIKEAQQARRWAQDKLINQLGRVLDGIKSGRLHDLHHIGRAAISENPRAERNASKLCTSSKSLSCTSSSSTLDSKFSRASSCRGPLWMVRSGRNSSRIDM
ncbi:hypothetical protein ACMFMG_002927 [Clarireedia jacksonii]